MNWKEFFKATKSKIITTLTLGVVALFLFYQLLLKSIGASLSIFSRILLIVFILPLAILSSLNIPMSGFSEVAFVFFFFILELVYLYLLSCLIIMIYNKLKRPKWAGKNFSNQIRRN